MNVKSFLKVDNGLFYTTVSLMVEKLRIYTTTGGARRGASVERRWLRVESCVYAPKRLYLDCLVWCVARLIPGREERACIYLNVRSKYVLAPTMLKLRSRTCEDT
jgi:hypothetical protein